MHRRATEHKDTPSHETLQVAIIQCDTSQTNKFIVMKQYSSWLQLPIIKINSKFAYFWSRFFLTFVHFGLLLTCLDHTLVVALPPSTTRSFRRYLGQDAINQQCVIKTCRSRPKRSKLCLKKRSKVSKFTIKFIVAV